MRSTDLNEVGLAGLGHEVGKHLQSSGEEYTNQFTRLDIAELGKSLDQSFKVAEESLGNNTDIC